MASRMTPYTEAHVPLTLAAWPKGLLFEDRNRRQNQRKENANLRMAVPPRRILVLGAGNPLRSDAGVGTRTVETLQAFFEFSDNVTFMRDWEHSRCLLHALMQADGVVVIDTVRTGSRPGTLCKIEDGSLRRTLMDSNSPHQARLADTIAVAEILGGQPETVIVAVEPGDMSSWSTQLTDTVELRIPDLVILVLAEIERMGGECTLKRPQPKLAFSCGLAFA